MITTLTAAAADCDATTWPDVALVALLVAGVVLWTWIRVRG